MAVWEIDAEDEKRLDRYEGFPVYYIKRQATVHMDDGSKIKGMLYQMNNKPAAVLPIPMAARWQAERRY